MRGFSIAFLASIIGWIVMFAIYLVHQLIKRILMRLAGHSGEDAAVEAILIMVFSVVAATIGMFVLSATGALP